MKTYILSAALLAYSPAVLGVALPTEDSNTPTQVEPQPEPLPTDFDCSEVIICIDGINECGQGWGTCIPACHPLQYTTPPCDPSTLTPDVDNSTTTPCLPLTKCIDYVDECNQKYGGCYDICGPSPTWPTPSCSLTETYPTETSS